MAWDALDEAEVVDDGGFDWDQAVLLEEMARSMGA